MTAIREINITDWTALGTTVLVDRYQFNVEVKWTDDAGVPHVYGPTTHQWPNALADVPLAALRLLMEEIIQFKVRVELGLDDWDHYG